MRIIGLTGPSGAGKSTLCEKFEELGIPCINTDDIYHEITSKPSPCLKELEKAFGSAVINENGSLDRTALARLVFEGEKAKENLSAFLEVFLEQVSEEILEYKISNDEFYITVEIIGENTNALIGYRGETLNALQTLLSSVANKDIEEKTRIILDISGYKNKRKKVLEELAEKISKTVIRTGKRVTLEPMPAYERKIIHSRLQENKKVTTESVGEEPHRKIIVELKRI